MRGATASAWSVRRWATELRGVTSRRKWLGRALGPLPALELTWVCCGVDYPKLVEGEADYLLYRTCQALGPRPRSLLLTEAGGYVGTFDGLPPPGDPPRRGGRRSPGAGLTPARAGLSP